MILNDVAKARSRENPIRVNTSAYMQTAQGCVCVAGQHVKGYVYMGGCGSNDFDNIIAVKIFK